VVLPAATNHFLDLSAAGPTTSPQAYECNDEVERVLKLPGLATGQALAADWIGALLAVELEVLTPRPCLVTVDQRAIDQLPPTLRDRARPGFAFGSEYIRRAQGVSGWDTVRACANHPAMLARLVVLDSWIDTQDRMRPDFGRNLLVDAMDARPKLTAIDFGMSLTSPLVPILGDSPPAEQVEPFVPDGLELFLDLAEVRATVERVATMSDAEIITLVRTTPDEWISEESQGAVIKYLMTRRQHVGPAVLSQLNGERRG
jgi:hypothetical protein